MAENNEIPEASENSGGEAEPEQNVNPEQSDATEQPETSKDARMWAMLCHLAGLAGFAFPFGNIILPLIFWQIKKDDFPFVNEQGKEALNFQISMTLYSIATIPLWFICIGPFLTAAVGIFALVVLIIAAIKANNGEAYRYPLTIRL